MSQAGSDAGNESDEPQSFFVRALYSYTASEQDESSLSFSAGDILEVLTQLPTGWWDGMLGDRRGWFPSNYVEMIDEEEVFGHQMMDLSLGDDEEADFRAVVDSSKPMGEHSIENHGMDNALSLSTSTYPENGDFSLPMALGSHFAELRHLMASTGDDGIDGTGVNAFEQLAEAAMLDTTHSSRLSVDTNASRSADVDDLGRSAPLSLTGELRSRPRASTDLLSPRRIDALPLGRERSVSASTGTKQDQMAERDYWVPRVTDQGDFIYYNTRTGATADDLPEEDGSLYPSGGKPLNDRASSAGQDESSSSSRHERLTGTDGDDKTGRSEPQKAASYESQEMPRRLHQDRFESTELQKMILPSPAALPLQVVQQAKMALDKLALLCSNLPALRESSDQDISEHQDAPTSQFLSVSRHAVDALRNILYISGVLDGSFASAAEAAHLASLEEHRGLARFALAIMVRSTDELAQTPPDDVREIGKLLTAATSKLTLSVRALARPTNGSAIGSHDDARASLTMQAPRDHYERVLETVNALRDFVRSLGDELEFHIQHGDAGERWMKSLHATLRSAPRESGVSHELMGGGSAAGLRGNGFSQPSAHEAAAVRLWEAKTLVGTIEAKRLVARGLQKKNRRPNQMLNAAYVQDALRPQLDDTLTLLGSILQGLNREESEENGPTPTPKCRAQFHVNGQIDDVAQKGNGCLSVGKHDNWCDVDKVLSEVHLMSVRTGTFLALLEDVDCAAVLDVDGEMPESHSPSLSRAWMPLIDSARQGLQTLAGLKQAAHDVTSAVMMDAQDVEPSGRGTERLRDSTQLLQSIAEELFQVLLDLAHVSEEQSRLQSPSIGARSRVYGVEEALPFVRKVFAPPTPSVSSLGDEHVRPTPQNDQATPHTNAAGAKTKAATTRHRSMSTGMAPAGGVMAQPPPNSMGQSIRRALTKRSTATPEDESDDKGDTDSLQSASRSLRLKKFFGEDAPTAAASQRSLPASLHREGREAEATQGQPLPPPPVKKTDDTPWFLTPDYASEDIVLAADGQVKGATLPALLERLTTHDSFDAAFNSTFLLMYRSFTTTETLLDMLFARYNTLPPDTLTPEEYHMWQIRKQTPIRLRVFNVLKTWLEGYVYPNEDDAQLDRIVDFASEMGGGSMEKPSRQLISLIERRRGEGEPLIRRMVMPNSAPNPITPRGLRSNKPRLLDIDGLELARQLTLLESKLYNAIKPSECIGKAWSRPDSDVRARGIKDTISVSNRITGWVAETILAQEDLKKRASCVKHFISVADACRSLQNFSSMTAIVSGLNSAPVYRLKRTWDIVQQRQVAILENLNRIMQSSKNFSDYRDMIHKLNPPCVPFLGVYLTDLTFIEDGNPNRLRADERLVNFGKRQKTAEVIREILIYQSTPYNLTPVASIQKYIEENLKEARSDTELYQQSLALEPREREDEKISRLLAESGFL